MPVVKPALARLLAIILAALVVVSGATIGFAMPANADEPEGPQLSVSVTDDLDPMGTEITITGTNYDATALAPSYYGLPEGAKAGFYVQVGYLDATWRPSEGAKSANRSNAYSRWVQGINTEEPYLIWTDNGDGTADFEWTLTIDKLTLNEKARAGAQLAVFTTGAGVTQADNEIAIPISFSTEQVLNVSVTDDLDPAGAEITITGYNYDSTSLAPSYYGLPEGAKAGFYVQVGYLDATWRPSEGAKSANRSNAYSRWVQGINAEEPYLMWSQNAANGGDLADFTWTLTIDKLTLNEKARAGAQLAVFTTGAGTTQAANEIAIPISFSTDPILNVSVTDDLDPAGAELTITGYNYDSSSLAPSYYGLPEGAKAGFYVQVGYLDATWRPSEGAKSANRSNAYSRWVQGINADEPYLKWSQNAANGGDLADFTWTVTIDKLTLNGVSRADADLAVFTVGAGGTQAANEIAVPISFDTARRLTVSQTEGLDPNGAEITITGYNYDSTTLAPSYYGLPEGAKAGFYAQVGYLDETWRPSESAGSAARSNAYSRWVQGVNTDEPYLKWSQDASNGDLADFTWTVTIDKDTVDAKAREGAQFAVFTVGAGGTQAANEDSIPLSWGEGTLTTGPVTIDGTVRAGETVTAKTSGWTRGIQEFKYQWREDGVDIAGATQETYTIDNGLIGKKLSVRVTGVKTGWADSARDSANKVVAPRQLTAATPTISGTPKVGQKLTAVRSTWTSGSKITYQWYANNKKIAGATKSTYVVQPGYVGKTITVKVTGSRVNFETVSKTSKATAKVALGTLTAPTPKISGTPKVGQKLTAVRGTWTSGSKITYQWYANNKKIAGATASTFKVTTAQKGKTITVKVTGSKTGYTTVTKTSAGKKVQ